MRYQEFYPAFLLLTVLLLILSPQLSARQTYSVKGTVKDLSNSEPLPGANVLFISVKDTTKRFAAITDGDGKFIKEGMDNAFYRIRITFVGYKTFTKFVRVSQAITNIGEISMEEDPQLLKEVQIEGATITAVQKGDTTQYNATAFKTNPDANAEDLITKMPGIIVDQSGVQAQGEQVQKVLVDGREFFGNDPSVALKSIPAEIIEKIEVFDQLSDQSQFSGFDDGNTTKTLNIVTKPEARQGRFGRLYAGYGTDDLYNAGGNVNEFENDRRISVIGMANNINQQNFADEDISGVTSSSGNRRRGRGGGRGGGRFRGGFNASGNASDFIAGQQSGITTTGSLGFNYSNKWDKLTINGSYFYNATDNSNDQLLSRETFLTADTSQFYTEASSTSTVNYNHRFNLRMHYEIDDRNSIIFTPALNLQQNDQSDILTGTNVLAQEVPLSQTSNIFGSDVSGVSQSGTLLYRHRFEKRGRTFSVRFGNSYKDTENNSELLAVTINSRRNTVADSTDQFTASESDMRSWSSNITYTEPVGRTTQMQFNYNYSVTNSTSDRKTFDEELGDGAETLNTELSNEFENSYITHRPTIGVRHRKGKLMARAGISYQNARLRSDQLFPVNAEVDQSFENILPDAMIMYRFTRQKNLRIIYRARTANPSVTQLQNVIDNSNPLFLSTGNPELAQSYSHTLITRYGNTKVDKSVNFFTFLYAGLTNNEVVNASFLAERDTVVASGVLLPAGGQLISPVNIDGAWTMRSFTTLGLPFGLLKSNINLNLGVNYARTPGLINGQENISNTLSTTSGFVVGSNISEKLDFTIRYTAGYTFIENSLQPSLNDNYFTQTSQLALNWIFSKGIVFRSDIVHQLYDGLSQDFDQSFFLWNMSVGKKILPQQRGEIRLDIFDLLNQNNNVSRTTTETYIEDEINQAIRQYFMLSFTYNIRDFKKTKKE